jgi:tRNA A37 threonylcarbamoyladenosine biosynthesis protein TsaE
MACDVVRGYQPSEGTCCVHLHSARNDGIDMFLRNTGLTSPQPQVNHKFDHRNNPTRCLIVFDLYRLAEHTAFVVLRSRSQTDGVMAVEWVRDRLSWVKALMVFFSVRLGKCRHSTLNQATATSTFSLVR